MIKNITPMLAKTVKEDKLRKVLADPDFVGEEKIDGNRYVAIFEKDRVYFTSRRESVKTGEKVEKGLNFPHLNKVVPELVGTVIDGEILVGKNSATTTKVTGASPETAIKIQKELGFARYYVFDILYYKNINVKNKPLYLRRQLLEEAINVWNNRYVTLVGQYEDKVELFNTIIEAGGEGIVIKNKNSLYEEGKRSDNWIKWKKEKTYDVVITGFTEPEKYSVTGEISKYYKKGWIGAVKYGVYDKGKLIEIGQTSGMSDEIREDMSKNKDKYIGKVMEVAGLEVTKDGVIRHPRFKEVREDKDPKEATLEALTEELS